MDYAKFGELSEQIMGIANGLKGNDRLLVGLLAKKARKVAEACPTDQTIVGMYNFLRKRAEKEMFISRDDLRDAYEKLYVSNNKFASHFREELGVEDKPERKMTRDPNEGHSLLTSAYDELSDPVLARELASAFDNTIPYRPYSESSAKSAQKTCAHELNCCGALPKKIDVVAGREDLLLCRAAYETPCGESAVIVPVELQGGKALIPTTFLSSEGFVELNGDSLKKYIVDTAGKQAAIDFNKLFKAVAKAKDGSPEPLSEVDRIVLKAASDKGTPATLGTDFVLHQKLDAVKAMAGEQKQPEEVQEFSKMLTSQAGAAEFVLGKEAVETSRRLVANTMKMAGFDKPQLAIVDSNENTIVFAVSVDGRGGFKVPVKVGKNTVEPPKMIVAESGIFEFSPSGIDELLKSATDYELVAQTSQVYGMKPSDVVEFVRKAMLAKKYEAAEDALNVLLHSGDSVAFKTAYSVYMDGLKGGLEKKASSISKCSAPVKTQNSQHLTCSHTGLPLHQVYQDENGHCLPLYRKKMAESSEGVSFWDHKVLMG